MDAERQRQISAEGGRAAHQKGTAHEFDSQEAREAGRKGGQASGGSRRRRSGGGTGGAEETREARGSNNEGPAEPAGHDAAESDVGEEAGGGTGGGMGGRSGGKAAAGSPDNPTGETRE